MKRNAVSTSLEDLNIFTSTVGKDSNSSKMDIGCNKQKMREPSDCNNQGYAQDYMDELAPWPPRSYTCSFCMREFRSAQALGGHMNVHRRDRARLRQSPPPPPPPPPPPQARNNHHYPLPNYNPNPNFSSSSASLIWPTFPPRNHKSFTSTLPTLVYSPFSPSTRLSSSTIEMQKWVKVDAIGLNHFNPKTTESTFCQDNKKLFAFTSEEKSKILKKTEINRLDLEIGSFDDSKEDLDLELRLGSS